MQQVAGELVAAAQGGGAALVGSGVEGGQATARQAALVQPVLVVEMTLGAPPPRGVQADAAYILVGDLKCMVVLVKWFCDKQNT